MSDFESIGKSALRPERPPESRRSTSRTVGQRVRRRVGIAGIALALATPVARADFYCNVTVQGVLPYNGGAVNVLHSGRGDWTIICNLDTAYTNGLTVSQNVCMLWTTLLLRAKKNNQTVQFWFPGTGACSSIGTYSSAPVPIYIGEIN